MRESLSKRSDAPKAFQPSPPVDHAKGPEAQIAQYKSATQPTADIGLLSMEKIVGSIDRSIQMFGDGGELATPELVRPQNLSLETEELPIQREVSVRGDANGDPVHHHTHEIEAVIDALDRAVQRAYRYIVARPLFDDFPNLVHSDGYVRRWTEVIDTFAQTGTDDGLARSFGYAVESLATTFLGSRAAGFSLAYQVASGGTRPDVVATNDDVTAWLDITSSGDAEHIYTRKNWNNPRVCGLPHAEVTYPSLGLAGYQLMARNIQHPPPQAAVDDPGAIDRQVARRRRILAGQLHHWETRTRGDLDREVRTRRSFGREVGADEAARAELFGWMNRYFHVNLRDDNQQDLRIASSVLAVLGKDGRTHGVNAAQSQTTGVAWLIEHDQLLPSEEQLAPTQSQESNVPNVLLLAAAIIVIIAILYLGG